MQAENSEHEQESLAQHCEPGMSDAWRELLGLSNETTGSAEAGEQQSSVPGVAVGAAIPALTNDPWAELQHEQGIEIVDLQQVRSQALNDLDLEQVLQCMQEQPTPGGQEK